jgi:hypothetical protein
MNKDDIELGTIQTTGDGTIIASGQAAINTYALLMWRRAIKLELKTGMKASRAVNIKTIIPQLAALGITDVQPNYSKARKLKAYADLDAFMDSRGMGTVPLDLPAATR